MAAILKSFEQGLNQTTANLAARINGYLTTVPTCQIKSASFSRKVSARQSEQLTVRLLIEPTWGVLYESALIAPGPGENLDQAFADWAAANPDVALLLVVNATVEEVSARTADKPMLLLLGTRSPLGSFRQVLVAAPIGNILAGATGNAIIYAVDGTVASASTPIYNAGAVTWLANRRNPVVRDQATGTLMGVAPP